MPEDKNELYLKDLPELDRILKTRTINPFKLYRGHHAGGIPLADTLIFFSSVLSSLASKAASGISRDQFLICSCNLFASALFPCAWIVLVTGEQNLSPVAWNDQAKQIAGLKSHPEKCPEQYRHLLQLLELKISEKEQTIPELWVREPGSLTSVCLPLIFEERITGFLILEIGSFVFFPEAEQILKNIAAFIAAMAFNLTKSE